MVHNITVKCGKKPNSIIHHAKYDTITSKNVKGRNLLIKTLLKYVLPAEVLGKKCVTEHRFNYNNVLAWNEISITPSRFCSMILNSGFKF